MPACVSVRVSMRVYVCVKGVNKVALPYDPARELFNAYIALWSLSLDWFDFRLHNFAVAIKSYCFYSIVAVVSGKARIDDRAPNAR